MHEARLGQVVVTDPGIGTGGYTLVAASSSVSPADRQMLVEIPQVSDYLHSERAGAEFFSFFRLPSGAWAFGKRFTHGQRRGTFNRIVHHTLVVENDALAALHWQPWLLTTACHYREQLVGKSEEYDSLTERSGRPGLSEVTDVLCSLPSRPQEALLQVLGGLRRGIEGEADFEATLEQVFGAIEAGRRLLLPQEPAAEQLLIFAWSLLPQRDRQAIPWTTHLAPGAGRLFGFANAPQPRAARAAQAQPATWLVFGEVPSLPGATALAQAISQHSPSLSRLLEQTWERSLSLLSDGTRVAQWVLRLKHGDFPPEGFPTPIQLGKFLDSRKIHEETLIEDADDAAACFDCAVGTVLQGARAGRPLASVAHEVGQILVRHGLAPRLLALDALEPHLARHRQRGDAAFDAALHLAIAAADFPDCSGELLLHVFRALWKMGDTQRAGHLGAEHLIAWLSEQPKGMVTQSRDLNDLLEALHIAPEGLAEALDRWPPPLYERALDELCAWVDRYPDAARQVAKSAAGSWRKAIRAVPGIVGRAEKLAAGGIAAAHWLPFALTEAVVLDCAGEEGAQDQQRFVSFVSRTALDTQEAAPFAGDVIRRLSAADATPGEAHRALVLKMAPAFVPWHRDLPAAFEGLARLSGDQFRAWGAAVAAVAAELHSSRHRSSASELGRRWASELAGKHHGSIPQAALEMMRALEGEDRVMVARKWQPLFASLAESIELRTLLYELAASDPILRRHFEGEILAARARSRQVDLTDAVLQAAALAQSEPEPEPGFLSHLKRILPADPRQRIGALARLLLSPKIMPSHKRTIEVELLEPALRTPIWGLAVELPPVSELTQRGNLLLAVALWHAAFWPDDPYNCLQFLRETANLNRFDAVGTFLRNAATQEGRSFKVFRQSFLRFLVSSEGGDWRLVRCLQQATYHPVHRVDLQPFVRQIRALPVTGG